MLHPRKKTVGMSDLCSVQTAEIHIFFKAIEWSVLEFSFFFKKKWILFHNKLAASNVHGEHPAPGLFRLWEAER